MVKVVMETSEMVVTYINSLEEEDEIRQTLLTVTAAEETTSVLEQRSIIWLGTCKYFHR